MDAVSILEGAVPVTGVHCESSALLNALRYMGYGFEEADIVGGGAAVSFLFMREGFPFIGGRNEGMREIFLSSARIPYGVRRAEDERQAREGATELLEKGLPVLIRADMRYLPYLYGGKRGPMYMSFGGHWVCLFGADIRAGLAWVTDTALPGLREILLADLDKARGSRTRNFPPRREYAWIELRPRDWEFDVDTLTRNALESILENYDTQQQKELPSGASSRSPGGRGPLTGLSGLFAFPAELASIGRLVSASALGPAYSYMAGSIERNGTGGAAFRRLFRDFLARRARDCPDPALQPSAES